MRRPDFPFAKYREWGQTPAELTQLDATGLLELADWQANIYRRPVLDDITGYYQFFPSQNGASSYVSRAAIKNPVIKDKIEIGDDLESKEIRHKNHIAESAELATALFWSTAVMRLDVVENTLGRIAQISEGREAEVLPDGFMVYAADAIADYGYCLQHPVDIDVKGEDHGVELHHQIERIAKGIGQNLLDFGNFTSENPQDLISYDGVVALQATLAEQERRIKHWAPRHAAVVAAFPGIGLSTEVLNLGVDFPEIFHLHHKLGNLS